MTYRDRLIALSRGFMAPRVFLTALELNVFGAVAAGPASLEDLAKRCGTSVRGAQLLLDALVEMGLLRRDGPTYRNIAEVAALCVPASGAEGSRFDHALRLWCEWSHLTPAIRCGAPVETSRASVDPTCLARWIALNAGPAPREIAAEFSCGPGSRILDVGGGSGEYAIELVAAQPDVTAVVLDVSRHALALADESARIRGVEGRVQTREADFFLDDLGTGFDLAILSFVCCLLDETSNVALLTKVSGALRSGGRIIVHDAMVDEADGSPHSLSAALFALTMLLEGGQVRSHQEVTSWLRAAGFGTVRQRRRGGSTVLDGTKP